MDVASRLFSPYDLNPGPIRSARFWPKASTRAPGARADQGVRHRYQRAYRPGSGIPEQPRHAGRPARLRLPAHAVPGGRDRRRGLLGRRLLGQPDDHASGAGVRSQGHHPRPDQPGRAAGHAANGARDLQLRPAQGAADDRAVAAGRRSRPLRGRSGRHAHPSDRQRGDGRTRLLVQAERRMGLSVHAARRGAPHVRGLPRRLRGGSRPAFIPRPSTSCSRVCNRVAGLGVLLAPVPRISAASAPRPRSGSRW
jgi:hypothetical protein